MHLYMPWWLDNKKLDFPRGYHIELGGGRRMPSAGFGGGIHAYATDDPAGHPQAFGGYGKQLKNDYRRLYGATVELRRPRRDDPERGHLLRDRSDGRRQVGHPGAALPLQVERLRVQAGEAHAGDLPRDHRRDGRHADDADADRANRATASRRAAGSSTSSACTRMGNDPTTSVLNKNCQAHDVQNLFVADGGPFVSQADKNPTWTILALAMRTQRLHRRAAEGRGRSDR